jgi:hypothetical protein
LLQNEQRKAVDASCGLCFADSSFGFTLRPPFAAPILLGQPDGQPWRLRHREQRPQRPLAAR